jgi:hypothetical protein
MEKIAVDSFVFYRSFATAAKKIPDQYRLSLYDAIVSYCLDGTSPELSDVADICWDLIKPQLDANKKRREGGIKGAEYGKLGGRPKNPIGDIDENPIGDTSKTPNGNENENGNFNGNDDDNGGPDPSSALFINSIHKESEKAGFILDDGLARRIAESGIDPAYLAGPHNFFQFAGEQINTGKYGNKPYEEKRLLFVKSFTWESSRADFPAWRDKRQIKAAAAVEKSRIDEARDRVPTTCGNCGASLNPGPGERRGFCPGCDSRWFFDEEQGKYIFTENFNLAEAYRNAVKQRIN